MIYCLYNEITIENSTFTCPHFPFKIHRSIPFRLNNQEHVVKFDTLRVAEQPPLFVTPHLASVLYDPDIAKLIEISREHNERSLDSLRIDRNGNVSLSLKMEYILIIGCTAFIGIIILMWKACCSCNNSSNIPFSPITNVVNTPPPPTPNSGVPSFRPDFSHPYSTLRINSGYPQTYENLMNQSCPNRDDIYESVV